MLRPAELLAYIRRVEANGGGSVGPGVATGGTTGQVLSKVDATDYNTTWVAANAHSHPASAPAPHAGSHASGQPDAVTPAAIGASSLGHTHVASNISDSTATGRSVLTAADASAARTAIGAGTSSLVIGTLATEAKAGNYQPASTNISDSTATGRSLLTAADAAAARTVTGAAAASHTHVATTDLTATGTKDATTFLRGDNTWAVPAGGSPPNVGTNFTNGAYGLLAGASNAFAAANAMYFILIQVTGAATLTGFWLQKGSGTTAGNCIGALYDAAGTRLAVTGTVAQGTVANTVIPMPFSSTIAVTPGYYYIGVIGSATTNTFMGWAGANYLGVSQQAAQATFATPATFAPNATTVRATAAVPHVTTY